MPDRILNNVVLPAPFAPIIPMIPPGGNLKLMSSINKLSSYDFERFLTSITISPSLGALGIII